jgi:hypothetical protein
MGLKDGINKVVQDQQKLQNQATSQAISPLTERVANNNTNPDSLKMAGTQAAQQGAASQLGKDQQAVQNGALAQQQQGAAQQRDLQSTGQSVADFKSEGVEKAQEAIDQKAQQWSQQMARFGSLGNRVSTAVQEEMAAGGQVAEQFEVNQQVMDEAVKALSVPGQEAGTTQTIQSILDSVQSGDAQSAITTLMNNAQQFNVDTTNSSAALTQIFEALNLDPSSQQAMVTNALADGIIDPDNLTMDFMLNQGILTTDNAAIPELGMTVAEIEELVGPEWRDLTAGQIAAELELSFDDKAERDDIMRELSNPNIDAGRKQELMRELQMLDASGTTSAEERAARGVDRTQNADQILMGDKLQSVEDVLSDENIRAKSDDLLMQMQADPENAAAILEKWKKDNPGYETMGDWINEQQAILNNKGEAVKSATELIEKKNKEAADFVNNNELFGADDGAKAILQELGFDTEGFGALGNDPATNLTYQALMNAKKTDPDKFELFKNNLVNMDKEDLQGLNGADIGTILDVLGTEEGMQEFNYLRELNNKLAITDTNSYTNVMTNIFPEGHPMRDIASDPKIAQNYLSDLRKMKDLGVASPELEALEALLDPGKNGEGGDGVIDDPSEIAERIQDLLGDGFNIGNFQGPEAKQLMDLINGTDKDFGSFIKETTTKQYQNWENSTGAASRKTVDDASSANHTMDLKQPWAKEPSSANLRKNKEVTKLAGKSGLKDHEGPKAAANMVAALVKNPDIFKSMPKPMYQRLPGGSQIMVASKELVNWVKKNIGLPNNKANHPRQVRGMINAIIQAGDGDPAKGALAIYGGAVDSVNKQKTAYQSNMDIIKNGPETNPWEGLM